MLNTTPHEKLTESIQQMLVDTKVNLPYYGNFNLFINFTERKDIDTCAVNINTKGMNFYFNSEFLNRLSQKEVNFITLHENFHLLWNHPKRTITGQYDHKLSNIAQDMIINHIIWQDIPLNFVEIPKDKDGKNMALFVPKEYTGKLIFEELYEWLRDERDKRKEQKAKAEKNAGKSGEKSKGDSGDDADENTDENSDEGSNDEKSYGHYGKNPRNENGTIETWSLDQILDNLDKNQGQYLDVHMEDEISEEMRESVVKDAMEKLQARGYQSGDIETTLNKLQKKRKDYLREIKRAASNLIFGTRKTKSIEKPNRRGIEGVKGVRKVKTKINVLLDCSGSMGGQGDFERVLSYIYQNDIEINFIQADTEVKWVEKFTRKKQLETMKIKGGGGTILQPGVDFIEKHYNQFNNVILTDGFCDSLDFSRIKGKVLLVSIGTQVPITKSNGKLKQILVEKN